jgi:hypothetical protein
LIKFNVLKTGEFFDSVTFQSTHTRYPLGVIWSTLLAVIYTSIEIYAEFERRSGERVLIIEV